MIGADSSIRLMASRARRLACRLPPSLGAAAFFALAHMGCVTHRVELTPQLLPFTAETRAKLGTIGIVAGGAASISLSKPRSRWASTATGAGGGAAVGLDLPLGSSDPCTPFIMLGVSALGTPVGAVAGYFKGTSAREVKAGEQQLRSAISQLHVEDLICSQLLQTLRTNTPYPAILVSTTNATAVAAADTTDWLANRGIDTVLEATVLKIGLVGERSRAAPLRSFIVLHVRLVRVADGVQLFEQTFTCQSGPLPFSGWSADGARAFRQEVSDGAARLAREVVYTLFSGSVQFSRGGYRVVGSSGVASLLE